MIFCPLKNNRIGNLLQTKEFIGYLFLLGTESPVFVDTQYQDYVIKPFFISFKNSTYIEDIVFQKGRNCKNFTFLFFVT